VPSVVIIEIVTVFAHRRNIMILIVRLAWTVNAKKVIVADQQTIAVSQLHFFQDGITVDKHPIIFELK
jgi:hypothetical protein